MKRAFFVNLIVLFAGLALLPAVAATVPAPGNYVPNEIIVKFREKVDGRTSETLHKLNARYKVR
jgi:hypothetical protein